MLEVYDVGVQLPGAGWLFRNLSFAMRPAKLCAILGPNGNGKTTLLKTLLGVQKLSEGRIERPANVGYVPQNLSVLFDFSVNDMVLMGRATRIGFFASPSRSDRQAAASALAEVGMSAFAQHSFSTLSGGQQQLVLLARALAGDAELVLLDEPTAGLDLANEARVLETVGALKQRGTTIVMTTHDPDHAMQLADNVLLMEGRYGQRFGATEDYLTDETLTRLYGIPLQRIDIETPTGPRSVLAKLHHTGATP